MCNQFEDDVVGQAQVVHDLYFPSSDDRPAPGSVVADLTAASSISLFSVVRRQEITLSETLQVFLRNCRRDHVANALNTAKEFELAISHLRRRRHQSNRFPAPDNRQGLSSAFYILQEGKATRLKIGYLHFSHSTRLIDWSFGVKSRTLPRVAWNVALSATRDHPGPRRNEAIFSKWRSAARGSRRHSTAVGEGPPLTPAPATPDPAAVPGPRPDRRAGRPNIALPGLEGCHTAVPAPRAARPGPFPGRPAGRARRN